MEILIQYKEIFSIAVVAIIEIIVFLVFKKNPKVIDNSLVTHLCDWIFIAEDKFKVGEDKMQYVLSEAKKYLGDEQFIESDIRKMVEFLLTLPEKKGKK